MFVIFLLPAVKNVGKKKKVVGHSWSSKTAQKITEKARGNAIYFLLFIFLLETDILIIRTH